MTWTRLDDTWTDKPEFEGLDHAARWHYLAMIQFCSRNNRADGVIRHIDARRCSDHPNPATALAEIEAAGLIKIEGTTYRVVDIDSHVPPPYVRNKAYNDKIRKRRERAHKAGDHSLCIQGSCSGVTSDVTRDAGTGQDGPGRAETRGPETTWPVVRIGEGKVAS